MSEQDIDDDLNTCHTFATEVEAQAFMLGFRMAGSDGIFPRIDPEEPQTILIDIIGAEMHTRDEAHGHYLETIQEWNSAQVSTGDTVQGLIDAARHILVDAIDRQEVVDHETSEWYEDFADLRDALTAITGEEFHADGEPGDESEEEDIDGPNMILCPDCAGLGFITGDGFSEDTADCGRCGCSGRIAPPEV